MYAQETPAILAKNLKTEYGSLSRTSMLEGLFKASSIGTLGVTIQMKMQETTFKISTKGIKV